MDIELFETGLLTFCHDVQVELKEMSMFNEQTEKLWERSDAELQVDLNERLKKIPKKHHDEFISDHGSDLHLNQTLFPSIHRTSTVIALHSYLEDTLNQLADLVAPLLDSEVTYKDLKGSGIERARLYFIKVGKFDFESLNCTWSVMKQVNKLRNQLVHNGGYLPEGANDAVNKFISSNKLLSGKPAHKVQISSDFVEFYIQTLIKFFSELDEEVAELIKRADQESA
ncbi:hypothetical protein UB33_11025 [Photobacterium angustum]|uniref:hypothetical protein n=1 Tax=Photobacterium angustum TaxID=661 RepID=UPI0005DE243F|nr:hypothetical protein [Photobacterium angustum]KJG05891.1 hypothetical protein UB33_11025 [Photobacterium angustum]PSV92617.1 hypothetical protein CTN01_12385 [Photobacterium angustum]